MVNLSGDLSGRQIHEACYYLFSESNCFRGKDMLFDGRNIIRLDISWEDMLAMQDLGLSIKKISNETSGRIAIVTSRMLDHAAAKSLLVFMRCYGPYASPNSPVRLFEAYDEAFTWLKASQQENN